MKSEILLSILSIVVATTAHAQVGSPLKNDQAVQDAIKAIVVIDNPQALKEAGIENPAKEEEGPDHTPSSPPLDTDDTGTPGPHGVEINFVGSCDRSSLSRECETLIDANYGIGKNVQFKVERPYEIESSAGEPTHRGMGATEVGVKWRFLDRNGLSAAIYPNFTVDNSAPKIDGDGDVAEREGNSIYVPLIIQKETKNFTIVTNTGYRRVIRDHSQDSVVAGVAIGHALNETSKIMGEVYSERDARTLQNRRTDVRVGYVKVIFPNKASHWEKSLVLSAGRSIGHTEDGKSHTTLRVGLSVVKK